MKDSFGIQFLRLQKVFCDLNQAPADLSVDRLELHSCKVNFCCINRADTEATDEYQNASHERNDLLSASDSTHYLQVLQYVRSRPVGTARNFD